MTATYFQETTATLREFLPNLIEEMERRVPYASVVVLSTSKTHIGVDLNKESIEPNEPIVGAVITVYDGQRLWEYGTHDFSRDNLYRRAMQLVEQALPVKNGLALQLGEKREGHFTSQAVRRPEDVSLLEKLELCKERLAFTKSLDPRLSNAIVNYTEIREQKLFVDRNTRVSQDLTRLAMNSLLFATDGATQEWDMAFASASGGFERLHLRDEQLVLAKDNAIQLLNAERIAPGLYDCITTPAISGLIAHEAFGHGTEVDMFLKDRAKGREYLNRQVAATCVSMYDDPTVEGAYGSHFIDDQGHQATRTTIIENGILKQGIGDLYSTSLMQLPRTSNGRRESYLRKAYSRMTNTYFGQGAHTLDEMMADVQQGVYLESGESGMEDPKGWGIQCTVHLGREIKAGKFTGKIYKSLGLTGYVPDLLQSISMVGNDFHLGAGTCGKGHKEWVPVTDGGPHLRLKGRLG
ncbi:TldD/PmbA family protein [Tumebacillus permanentifrigoris]|uniref:TldD protein n=1 Tax=Tumebacillus permanentifrigoris TaxID=378543 RepID=A0A316D6I6_9BACL|nr:TldD/PmbA family protein [Tumebacillus permanentifrigoris]PWK11212.1 TldD protein [Tumebacillus permanentifrigoris]